MEKDLRLLALKRVVKDKVEKEIVSDLPVEGTVMEFDFVAHIRGSLTKGADYDMRVVQKAAPWRLLAVALSKLNGVTVEAIVREALISEVQEDEIKERADKAVAALKAPTLSTCKGKITTDLNVEFK